MPRYVQSWVWMKSRMPCSGFWISDMRPLVPYPELRFKPSCSICHIQDKVCPNILMSINSFLQTGSYTGDTFTSETREAPMLPASIDPFCSLESRAEALRTKDVSVHNWDYVGKTLIDKYNAKLPVASSSSAKNRTSRRRNRGQAHSASKQEPMLWSAGIWEDSLDMDPTVRAFAIALKSVKSSGTRANNQHGNFCDKVGLTANRCFLNPENPNNRLPEKVRRLVSHKSRSSMENVAAASSRPRNNEQKSSDFKIVDRTAESNYLIPTDGQGIYADNGATAHCFHSKSSFVPGSHLHRD